MIFHIREEEKKVVKNSIVNLESVLEEVKGLGKRYDKECKLEVDSNGLIKFMRKGRFNFFDGNFLFKMDFEFNDEIHEKIALNILEKDSNFYIETVMISDRKDEGITEIRLLDNLKLMSTKALIERLVFKFAEITMKVSYKYEKDISLRNELEEVAKKLNWLGELGSNEIESAELELSNLDVLLGLSKKEGNDFSYKVKEDILGVGFKRYRSLKEICIFDDGTYEDTLKVVKGENGKHFYEVKLTKVDSYKGETDIVNVYERREVNPYGYERIIRDVVPVYVSTVKSRLENTSEDDLMVG